MRSSTSEREDLIQQLEVLKRELVTIKKDALNYEKKMKAEKESFQSFCGSKFEQVSLYSRYYAEASGGAHLRGLAPGQNSFEETSKRWRAVGDTASNLTGLGIELKPPTPVSMSLIRQLAFTYMFGGK